MNEFELRKYYREFKVGSKTGLSFSSFKSKCEADFSYRHHVTQGIYAMRKPHVRERMFQNTLDFAEA